MRHAHLYLSESDDEQDSKSAAAKKFYVSCGGGGSSSSLSATTVSVSAIYDLVCYLIFMSYLLPSNDSLPSDDMVDWDNISMLGIGDGDTNIDEGSDPRFLCSNVLIVTEISQGIQVSRPTNETSKIYTRQASSSHLKPEKNSSEHIHWRTDFRGILLWCPILWVPHY